MSVKVVTGPLQWSYVHVLEPYSVNGGSPRYSLNVLIDKNDSESIEQINRALHEEYDTIEWGNEEKVPLSSLKLPVFDGDKFKPNDTMYRGKKFFTASSRYAPGVIDLGGRVIRDASEIYGGCFGRVSVTFESYKIGGKVTGITCRINNLQKTSDDPNRVKPSRSSAFDDFGVTSEIPF